VLSRGGPDRSRQVSVRIYQKGCITDHDEIKQCLRGGAALDCDSYLIHFAVGCSGVEVHTLTQGMWHAPNS
jgi:hypothetical protein